MLGMTEIELKLRNKQHHLEQLAQKLSDDLHDHQLDGNESAVESSNLIRQAKIPQVESYTQQELQQVKHAILRIKQGVYSDCELCGSNIEVNRLLALPYTALCLQCASEQ